MSSKAKRRRAVGRRNCIWRWTGLRQGPSRSSGGPVTARARPSSAPKSSTKSSWKSHRPGSCLTRPVPRACALIMSSSEPPLIMLLVFRFSVFLCSKNGHFIKHSDTWFGSGKQEASIVHLITATAHYVNWSFDCKLCAPSRKCWRSDKDVQKYTKYRLAKKMFLSVTATDRARVKAVLIVRIFFQRTWITARRRGSFYEIWAEGTRRCDRKDSTPSCGTCSARLSSTPPLNGTSTCAEMRTFSKPGAMSCSSLLVVCAKATTTPWGGLRWAQNPRKARAFSLLKTLLLTIGDTPSIANR